MQDEPTSPIPPAESEGSGSSPPSGAAPPPPAEPPPPAWHQPVAGKPKRLATILGHRAAGWFVAALLVGVVTGLAVALANAPSGPARAVIERPSVALPPNAFQTPLRPPGARIPAEPFAGGALAGRVQSTSTSSFTVATPSGSDVKVDEQSSTIYRRDGSATTKASVKKGVEVFVVGTRSGSTVKASLVTIITIGPRPFYLPG